MSALRKLHVNLKSWGSPANTGEPLWKKLGLRWRVLAHKLRLIGARGLATLLLSQPLPWGCIRVTIPKSSGLCKYSVTLFVHPTSKRMPLSGLFLQIDHPSRIFAPRKSPPLTLARSNLIFPSTSKAVLSNLRYLFLTLSPYSNYMKSGPLLFLADKRGSIQVTVACI